MSMFGYFKIPDVILTLASSQKLNWTHSFDTPVVLAFSDVELIFRNNVRLYFVFFLIDTSRDLHPVLNSNCYSVRTRVTLSNV